MCSCQNKKVVAGQTLVNNKDSAVMLFSEP